MKISLNIVGITILLIVFIVLIFLFIKKYKQKNQDQKYIDDNVEMFMQEIQKISDIIENYSNNWVNSINSDSGNCITFNNVSFYQTEINNLKTNIATLLTQVNNKFSTASYNKPRNDLTGLIGVDADTSVTPSRPATGLYLEITNLINDITNVPDDKLCSSKCIGDGQKYVITQDTNGKYTGKCVCNNELGFIHDDTGGTNFCKNWKSQYTQSVDNISTNITAIGASSVQLNPTLSSTVVTASDASARVVV